MSDIKWVKIATDTFSDEKILLIESLPESDAMLVIWIKLLCLAGKLNSKGLFVVNESIPVTESMLSSMIGRKESTVRLALDTFVHLGMIDFRNGVYAIRNWSKHQNVDAMEKRKEYNRNYMKDRREREKQLALEECKDYCSPTVGIIEERNKESRNKNNNIYISAEQKNCSTQVQVFIPLNSGEEFPVYESDVSEWSKLYPAVDVKQELNNMRGWCLANPTKRKTKSGVKRFINSWLSKTQNKGGTNGYAPVSSAADKAAQTPKKYKQVRNEDGEIVMVEEEPNV